MRILLLHDEIYPDIGPNVRIVYRIVDELLKHSDVDLTIVGRAQTKEQFKSSYKSARIIHYPWQYAQRYHRVTKKMGRWKFLRYIIFPHAFFYRRYHNHLKEPYQAEILIWTYRHRREFDVILACSQPEYTVSIASLMSKYLPVVYYYMEPLLDMEEKRMVWDSNATKIILPEIYANTTSIENRSKNVIVEFCNVSVRSVDTKVLIKTDHNVNLAFVGNFYPTIRNPQYIFDILDNLQKYGSYGLHIVGGFNGSFPKSFVDKYFTNAIPWIHYYGLVLPDVADSYLQAADVLVHIANKTSSQMPSKILDYIATGKPILNFYYNDDCPTLPVLEKYPLVLNAKMGEPISEDLLQRIDNFCQLNKGLSIPFEIIEQHYEKYTPDYVGEIFYKTLSETMGIRKHSGAKSSLKEKA